MVYHGLPHKNGDDWGMLYGIVLPTLMSIPDVDPLAVSADSEAFKTVCVTPPVRVSFT